VDNRISPRLRLSGLWRQPDFVRFWAANAVSQLGSHVGAVALPLTAAVLLRASPGQMGLLTAASSAPFLLIGLFVGVWVDRVRRRPLLITADLARSALLLLVPLVWALDALRIEVLYAVALLVGAFGVVFDVAWVSYLPSLVRRDRLIEANGKLFASDSVAQVTGPGVGGVLVGLLTAPFAILVDALSYLASALFLWRVRSSETVQPGDARREPVWRGIAEGLRAVFRDPLLRALVACGATTSLFGYAFLAVYVLYLTEWLRLGPSAIGFVFAAGGVGALIGASLAPRLGGRFGPGRAILGAQLLVGVGAIPIPLAVLFPPVALLMVLASEFVQWMALLVYNVNQLSLRQAVTPDRLQGRVTATNRFVVAGATTAGALLGGTLGEAVGVPATLVIGVLGMSAAVLWVFFSPVRTTREWPSPVEEEVSAAPVG
jgi:predicted MFS family arabinose efflux permease